MKAYMVRNQHGWMTRKCGFHNDEKLARIWMDRQDAFKAIRDMEGQYTYAGRMTPMTVVTCDVAVVEIEV